jgi:L-serine dehydratase
MPDSSSVPPYVGVFDLFRIGIGPSSSHTVGPMRAARAFLEWVRSQGGLHQISGVTCELFGSLAYTGMGHATDKAVILGLGGEQPDTVDPDRIPAIVAQAASMKAIALLGEHRAAFDPATDLVFRKRGKVAHPNTLRFTASKMGQPLFERTYYSIGGGFIRFEGEETAAKSAQPVPYPFRTAAELLAMASAAGVTIAELCRINERMFRSEDEIDGGIDILWNAMRACVERGIRQNGELPGSLRVRRRAAALHSALMLRQASDQGDPLGAMEWVNLYALAVNEENASGGRVVTAPTNGAAGIVPAVLHYYRRFISGASPDGIRTYFLTAAAIGSIIKRNASISGAEVGCQGEVGSAAAMAAAGLTAALGGTSAQVENAAEIALEHNLGLTCDPVGGLVQIPCIERNAIASVKAINAARLALCGDGTHYVTLDQAIETMRQTGRDMNTKYKETSQGGLAVSVPAC